MMQRLGLALCLAAVSVQAKVFDVLDFGAKPDNKTINTAAIRATVEAAASSPDAYNEIVFPGPGIFVTGAVNFTSSLTVTIEAGAEVAGSTDESDYPVLAPLPSFGSSRDVNGCCRYAALFSCFGCSGFALRGNGVLDGRGQVWWDRFRAKQLKASRPHLFEVYGCRNVSIGGHGSGGLLTFAMSPFWTTHLFNSSSIHIKQLNISNPTGRTASGERAAPNTDGIDPDSCQDVLIEDSIIYAGDDAIAIKSGLNNAGIRYGAPTRNVTVRNVTASSPCCAGVCIGSEMSGGVSDVSVTNVTVLAAAHAFYVKSARGRGGYVRNVSFAGDLYVGDGVVKAMELSDDYGGKCEEPSCNATALPLIDGILFSGISSLPGQKPLSAGAFQGLQGDDFHGVTVEDISLTTALPLPWSCTFMDMDTFRVRNVTPPGLTDACKY